MDGKERDKKNHLCIKTAMNLLYDTKFTLWGFCTPPPNRTKHSHLFTSGEGIPESEI